MFKGTLIRSGNNAKTVKGDGEYETAIMYLAPFTLAGSNVCPMAEQAGCVKGCLNTAGRGAYNNVQVARINKTKRYLASRTQFMADLVDDLERFVAYCERKGVKPAVRLNGTSDIQWEVAHFASRGDKRGSVFELFPEVQFYDYTKVYKRAYRALPVNYSLTLSYSHASTAYAEAVVKAANETGANIAVVYRTKELRDTLASYDCAGLATTTDFNLNRPVFNGDETDLRFLDPKGVIVGLYAKGAAKGDRSGFVVG
ncbi:hypothetical protein SAMN02927900_04742 [Rhizobium mongolense subsp. loessense]|uniref:Gene product 88 domain-containing protein n=1 Tax=Rhizobium mongolense subsp. loessense TaxID=158890 RepID=A0A1G4T6E5_9HYPH|nr:hypothetical protein [Rhizobium mongolense]SCW76963.1 hypothetical protein SAMN02927900_04742 [Rhizobium mongolense subsp. loessense]